MKTRSYGVSKSLYIVNKKNFAALQANWTLYKNYRKYGKKKYEVNRRARNQNPVYEAIMDYREHRENGTQQDDPILSAFPEDGSFSWDEPGAYRSRVKYIEGPKDRAWMEAKDRRYLMRLKKEKQSAENQDLNNPGVPISQPQREYVDINELIIQFKNAVDNNDFDAAKMCLEKGLPLNTLINQKNLFKYAFEKQCDLIAALVLYFDRLNPSPSINLQSVFITGNKFVDNALFLNRIQSNYEKVISSSGPLATISIPQRLLDVTYVLEQECTKKAVIKNKFNKFYQNLYSRADLQSLLSLAALATHGIHQTARSCGPSFWERQFKVFADPHSIATDNVYLSLRTLNAVGLQTINHVYLGVQDIWFNPEKEQCATLIHEITHFIAKEIYDNYCLPYKASDKITENMLSQVCNMIRSNAADTAFDGMFRGGYQLSTYNTELIARTTEYLWNADDDPQKAKIELENFCKPLHDFYFETFLKDCETHYQALFGGLIQQQQNYQQNVGEQIPKFKMSIEQNKSELDLLKKEGPSQDAQKKITELEMQLAGLEMEHQILLTMDKQFSEQIAILTQEKQQFKSQKLLRPVKINKDTTTEELINEDKGLLIKMLLAFHAQNRHLESESKSLKETITQQQQQIGVLTKQLKDVTELSETVKNSV